MHFGGALHQVVDLLAVQAQGHGGEAAHFHLGVLVDHLGQRQDEQPRGVGAGEAVPAGELHVADEGAVGEHQVLVEVEPAVRAARAAGGADHQAQHGVAPAAGPVVVGFGEQVVHFVDPLGVEAPQGFAAEVAPGVEVGQFAGAAAGGVRGPAEVVAEVAVQRGASAAVVGVEEEVLHVHRDEFAGLVSS